MEKNTKIAMEKKLAGERAAEEVSSGMIVGLGTGSTVRYTIEKIAERVRRKELKIHAVSTSQATTELARKLEIPLIRLEDIEQIDVTIDGADEVTPGQLNGIKGGGGALLQEKIVASASRRNVWVVDSSKVVQRLGKFPLPVEVIPRARRHVLQVMERNGWQPVLRKNAKGGVFVTDNGNEIIDLYLGEINDPISLEGTINRIPGVVENGLFLNRCDRVICAVGNRVIVYEKGNNASDRP